MKSCSAVIYFFFLILCFQNAYSGPINKDIGDIPILTTFFPSYAAVLISFGALIFVVYFILGCVCCPNKSIKALSYQNGFPVSRLNENNFENQTEITIFPPQSTIIDLQPVNPSFPGFDEKVTFEPLPDILPKNLTGQSAACSSKPAHFSALLKSKVSLHDWFDDPNSNFPREQLQYFQEIGVGWFGRVVEGEASQICDNEEKSAVIVKILREEASPSEHLHFLHEVRPYRDLRHSSIIKLLGRCLESDPFLLIMEHSVCDLKTYLIKQEKKEIFLQDGLMLQMISNIASGLRYMHDKGFCHMDFAAHNCFVCSDNSVKIGDYGISFDRWKSDYYCLGDIALPVRWYSPEILLCSETTIETKEITREANVWAFGVVLWEITELGKLPYEDLSDEDVLQKVLIDRSIQLSPTDAEFFCRNEIVLVMKECWRLKKHRPPMEKIENFIMQLYNDRLSISKQELSFEERWNSIQPKITEISSYTGTESSSLKFENDFSTRSDLQNYSSDNEILSSFEMSFDMLQKTGFNGQFSPSLNVLNGSIDELTENDVYLNSISLSCGKYDADTLSNISDKDNFQMEEDKENSYLNNAVSDQVTAAVIDLDLVSANQPDLARNSSLENTKSVLPDSELVLNDKVPVNENIVECQDLNKSCDLSNISEYSLSKSSNPSDHVPPVSKDNYNDISANSDLNGNHSFYDNVQENNGLDSAKVIDELKGFYSENIVVSNNYDDNTNMIMKSTDTLSDIDLEHTDSETKPINTFSTTDNRRISIVPDIVIHESPSIKLIDNSEENIESETNINTEQNPNLRKSFRFVLKDEDDKTTTQVSHEDLSKEIAYDLRESLKTNNKSKPLTSTPVKSSSDSVSSNFNFTNDNINENNLSDVFSDLTQTSIEKTETEIPDHVPESNKIHEPSSCEEQFNFVANNDTKNISEGTFLENRDSTNLDHFTTAESSLISKEDTVTETFSEEEDLDDNFYINHIENNTILNFHNGELSDEHMITEDYDAEKNDFSDTLYVSAESSLSKQDKMLPDVISPPNGYVSSHKEISISSQNSDTENDYYEKSKASETVSPPQAFQDESLGISNDSFSESKASFELDLSTSAECGSSENLDQYLEEDHISSGNISSAKLLETSFPHVESKSFTYDHCADFSGNMRPRKSNSNSHYTESGHKNPKLYLSDYSDNHRQNCMDYNDLKAPVPTYDQMIVEDLETGEQTVINESYSVCDDYENSVESDEILKINTETDEAIIVDSSEALIGFVPSRSIELLQEYEVIPPLNPSYALEDDKESSDSMNIDAYNSASPSPAAMKHNSSPFESPELAYSQPYRNFCLQNEVIEEEITEEIVSPSSFHSSSSYCSNEVYLDEEKMSQSSESAHQGEMYETSVLPSVDHLYVVSDDGSKTDVSSSDCSPVQQNEVMNTKYKTDSQNNHITDDDQEDVMHSYQPTQSVRWLSDETLDVDGDDESPIIIEGREILAGDVFQTCELTAEDIASALSQLELKDHKGLTLNHLNVSQSPSPFSSVESSPCRDTVYTPDFESDSEETASGTSCSSTSGSFECIHNKFKNTVDISKVVDESDKSASSREQSPMKIFSKTWDCHATPTKGVLVTPEKKFNSMRKSVSFHEEDPQVVFEYPPASDSSEDGYPSDENEEFPRNIDYLKYADWDLQATDGDDIEEIIEIEELESEPYVRRPTYSSSSVGPLNRPMLYTLTAGFSDEDLDLSEPVPPSSLIAPSNSPDENKFSSESAIKMCELIQSHLKDLAKRENKSETGEKTSCSLNHEKEVLPALVMSVQDPDSNPVEVDDIIIEEFLPECQTSCESVTVHKDVKAISHFGNVNISDDGEEEIEEIIIEELSDEESDSENLEIGHRNQPFMLDTEVIFSHEKENVAELSPEMLDANHIVSDMNFAEKVKTCVLSDVECVSNFSKDSKITPKKLSELAFQNLENAHIENSNGMSNNEINCNEDMIVNEQDKESLSKAPCSLKENVHKENYLIDKSTFQGDLIDKSTFQGDLMNFVEDSLIKVDADKIGDDSYVENKQFNMKSSSSNLDSLQFNFFQDPVHVFPHKSNDSPPELTSSTIVYDNSCNISMKLDKISFDDAPEIVESPLNSSSETEKEKKLEVIPNCLENYSGNFVKSDMKENSETTFFSENSSFENNEKPNCANNVLNSQDSSHAFLLSEACVRSSTFNEPQRFSDSLTNETEKLAESTDESSCPENENVAQNDTQQVNSSSSALADLSDIFSHPVFSENKITDVKFPEDILSNVKNENVSNSEAVTEIAVSNSKEKFCGPSTVVKEPDDLDITLHVPKIIVTPASESEVEDELEEYLRGQLEHFHPEAPPPEDFSVTSEFSSRPFDEVFGSYFSGDSTDYIEAFNFEFENDNFLDNFADDYPHVLQSGINDTLYPIDSQQKRSSSLPLMTENLSDDDSFTMKSDSSLTYDSSKNITHL